MFTALVPGGGPASTHRALSVVASLDGVAKPFQGLFSLYVFFPADYGT